MSKNTKIEWADHSWSPWRGCTKISPGCANCYAETLSKRNPAVLGEWGKGKPRVLAKNWGEPLRWNARVVMAIDDSDREASAAFEAESVFLNVQRPRVFPSLCDWLDDEVPIVWFVKFLHLIHDTPHLDWLLLTKRPENWESRSLQACHFLNDGKYQNGTAALLLWLMLWRRTSPPDNVWFGVSVEDQQRAHQRVPLLLKIPAKVRWLSLEPLLGPVDFRLVPGFNKCGSAGTEILRNLWVVIGGESGPWSRPCDVKWIRSLKNACQSAGVPVFVKQLGSRPFRSWDNPPGNTIPEIASTIGEGWTLEHPKGGDPLEWPTDLRVREFPEVHP